MDGATVALVIGGSATLLTAIGALVYTSPGRAWKLLVENLSDRVKNLEAERDEYKAAMKDAEKEVRRLRTIRSVLEDLIRQLGGTVPFFHDGEHHDVAPERRANPIATVVVTDPETLNQATGGADNPLG